MVSQWLQEYEKVSRLKLSTVGRRTGRKHEVMIDFVVDGGRVFVTGAKSGRDWMKNALKNPNVEVAIEERKTQMRAERISSEETRSKVEKLFKTKYRISARLLRLARRGSVVFELKSA